MKIKVEVIAMLKATIMFRDARDVVMHIAVLLRIAMADGKFLDAEKTFITNAASLYASTCGTKTFDKMVDDCIANLPKSALDGWMMSLEKRPVEARNLVKDMIALGCVDGEYCEEERKEVHEIATKLNVPNVVVEAIETLLLNLIKATQDLQIIIECGTSKA